MVSLRSLIPLVGFISLVPNAMAAPAATTKPPCNDKAAATPTLPVNGGPTELPAPTGQLVKVAIGKGVQNYTCSAVGAVPVSDGALATLFDVTSLAYTNIAAVHSLPPICVDIPPQLVPYGKPITLGRTTFPVLGVHFFTPALVPTFSLTAIKDTLSGKVLTKILAPATASKGPAGTGAVPWLQLGDSGVSVGTKEGYRVETAGGVAPSTCSTTGIISVQYCAEYWFYTA